MYLDCLDLLEPVRSISASVVPGLSRTSICNWIWQMSERPLDITRPARRNWPEVSLTDCHTGFPVPIGTFLIVLSAIP